MTINIKVKTLDGQDHIVNIDENAPLQELRNVLESKTSIPKDRQRLIYRGRPLTDDNKSLLSYGVLNDHALHLVDRPPPAPRTAASSSSTAEGRAPSAPNDRRTATRTHMRSSNLIVGNIPIERTLMFSDPQQTLQMVNNAIAEMTEEWNLDTNVTLIENRPEQDDISINVVLRGRQETTADSPARERLEAVIAEIKRLLLILLTLKNVFHSPMDQLARGEPDPEEEEKTRILATLVRSISDAEELTLPEARALFSSLQDERTYIIRAQLQQKILFSSYIPL
jgi:hypothetical protein